MDVQATNSLWGEYDHFVDDKGRVVVPQDLAKCLTGDFVITRAPEHALFIFPMNVWEEIERKLRGQVIHREMAIMQRLLGGRSIVKIDAGGRLLIPKHLRDWAGLADPTTATIIGMGNKIEIWAKIKYTEFVNKIESDQYYDAALNSGLTKRLSSEPAAA